MQDQAPTIGFIGLGVMGGPMCRNVGRKHPAPVYAFDLDPAAVRDAAEVGVRPARSIAEVAAASEIIFLSLPGGTQVEEVCFGKDGIAGVGRRGLIVVDLSTTSVAKARAVGARLAQAGIDAATAFSESAWKFFCTRASLRNLLAWSKTCLPNCWVMAPVLRLADCATHH